MRTGWCTHICTGRKHENQTSTASVRRGWHTHVRAKWKLGESVHRASFFPFMPTHNSSSAEFLLCCYSAILLAPMLQLQISIRYCCSDWDDHFLYNFTGVVRRSSTLLCSALVFLFHRTTNRYIRFTSVLEKRWFWWWFCNFLGLFFQKTTFLKYLSKLLKTEKLIANCW